MPKIFLILFFLCLLYVKGNAQYRHYISLNTLPYALHANKEKEPVLSKDFLFPRLSYKICKKQHGIEAYLTANHINYLRRDAVSVPREGDVWYSFFRIIGINYQHTFYVGKEVEINPFAGFNVGVYEEQYVVHVFPPAEAVVSTEKETLLGIQGGGNITIPVWKGFYVNGNLRYTVNPWAKYQYYKYNIVVEAGLGYKIRKRNKE